jgi:hypothetical protein
VWFTLLGIAAVTALVIAAWRYGGSGHQTLPLSRPAAARPAKVAGGLLVRAKKGVDSLLIVRAGSAKGRQLWNGTLSNREYQRFDVRPGLWVYLGSPENVVLKLNGRVVVVGGGAPKSLIIPAGSGS